MSPPDPLERLLVHSKLERPHLPRGLLQRGRISKRLARSLERRATLVSAPAGYGKSTLVAQFLESDDTPPAAWLSLESLDSDLSRFVRYFVAALREVVPDCLPQTERLLRLSDLPPPQYLAESTVAELESLGQRVVLVLDDYHLIRSPDVHDWLESVVSKLPRTLHLVVISRIDPPLPLSLWRSRRWLGEVRLADLRFSLQETKEFFESAREHELGDEHIAALYRKTEGWITALRLFLLTLAGSGRTEERVQAFSASDRVITDYLLDEVLAGQPPEIMEYLAVTSLLERFSPQLTDELLSLSHPHLAGQSHEIIDRLFRMNLFLVPLGSVPGWYRYHHLFRDLLLDRFAQRTSPTTKESILDSAGEWFEREGHIEDALRCFLAADDLDAAAELVASQLHIVMAEDPSRRTLRRWLEMFPAGAERSRVPLLIAGAYCKSIRSDYKGVSDFLEQVEVIRDGAGDNRQKKWCSVFQHDLNYLQCFASFWDGDVEKTYEYGQRLLDPASNPPESIGPFWPSYCAASQALTGRRAEFLQYIEDSTTGPGSSGLEQQWPFVAANAYVLLCWGDLVQCRETASQLLADEPFPTKNNCSEMGHLLLGSVAYEFHRLDEAERHFEAIVSLRFEGLGFAYWDALAARVWIDLARGRIESARRHAAAARAFAVKTNNRRLIPQSTAIEQRLALVTGEPVVTAASRPSERDFTSPSIIPPSQNWAWLELQSLSPVKQTDALEFIDAALNHADEHGVVRRVIQLRTLRALALDSLDRRNEAISALQAALQQGAGLGFVRSFIDAGEGIRPLLQAVAEQQDDDGYVAMLLDVLDGQGQPAARQGGGTTARLSSSMDTQQAPITNTADRSGELSGDQLTNREMDVLELLQRRLSNKEIAAGLGISPATVKMHTLNIYGKLGVHSRRKAVTAATGLGILSR